MRTPASRANVKAVKFVAVTELFSWIAWCTTMQHLSWHCFICHCSSWLALNSLDLDNNRQTPVHAVGVHTEKVSSARQHCDWAGFKRTIQKPLADVTASGKEFHWLMVFGTKGFWYSDVLQCWARSRCWITFILTGLSFGSTASCSMYNNNINIIIIIALKLRSPNLNSQNSHERANEFNLQLAVALKWHMTVHRCRVVLVTCSTLTAQSRSGLVKTSFFRFLGFQSANAGHKITTH